MRSRNEIIYEIARRVPAGTVATYGQIAALAGLDGHARQVGYALNSLPAGSDVPWHRVINARGEISPRSASDSHELQRLLLEAEGVEFDLAGRVSLEKYRWNPTETRLPRSPSRRRRETPPTPVRGRR
ncbi:MAG TPA: MGMT family protein [Thermoanaerobaculia bacterium]|nr:MGMT family protein [Thermoanaerobaculia bacterium]